MDTVKKHHHVRYCGFYPSIPYWAVTEPSLAAEHIEGTGLHDQMAETVFSVRRDQFDLRFARDGRVLLKVGDLESKVNEDAKAEDRLSFGPDISNT